MLQPKHGHTMSLLLRHGLTGEEVLSSIPIDEALTGWDIMVQVASCLKLATPFQVHLCPHMTEQTLITPFRAIAQIFPKEDTEISFVIHSLQHPTVEDYQTLAAILLQKNPTMLSLQLGRSLDLSRAFIGGGHASALVALAMLRDHDNDDYLIPDAITMVKHPSTTVCLTYLMLQARACPNLLSQQQQPTSMIGLASALGNHDLVKLLLNSMAKVHIEADTVPPLMAAVLNGSQGIAQSLALAHANPWQRVPIGALMDLPYHPCDVAQWRETVCAMQIAAAKKPASLYDVLREAATQARNASGKQHSRRICKPSNTALTERIAAVLQQIITDYDNRNGPHTPHRGRESLRWKRILAGLGLPVLPVGWIQSDSTCIGSGSLLHQLD